MSLKELKIKHTSPVIKSKKRLIVFNKNCQVVGVEKGTVLDRACSYVQNIY